MSNWNPNHQPTPNEKLREALDAYSSLIEQVDATVPYPEKIIYDLDARRRWVMEQTKALIATDVAKHDASVEISPIVKQLRSALDAEGIKWCDASEEFGWNDYTYHMERTKVIRNDVEIASCIWGYTVLRGHQLGSTYGWPAFIESKDATNLGRDPEPKTVEEILEAVRR